MGTILLILQLLPTILAAIVAIENIFKGVTAAGSIKKQIIMDNLEGQDPKILSVVSSRIDKSVASFNKAGVFTHGTGVIDTPVPAALSETSVQNQAAAQQQVGVGNIGSRT